MTRRPFDLVVLGAGAGLALASRAAEAGWRVALVDPGPLGGTCLNRGCIPSKFLVEHARAAACSHVTARDTMTALRRGIASARRDLGASLPRRLTWIRARAVFEGPLALRAGDRLLRARRVVLATGSRPFVPPALLGRDPPGRSKDRPQNLWTSDDVFTQRDAPASLVVVGGGFVACELAHAFAAFGTRVTLLEARARLLEEEDEDVSRLVTEGLSARMRVRTRCPVEAIESVGGAGARRGRVRVRFGGPRGGRVEADAVLVAVGRRPHVEGLALERAGIETDERGAVRVDARLRTTARGVFAIGDVNGIAPFTHAAVAQADWLGDALLEGRRGPFDGGPVPHAVFTDPEVGAVGATEQDLRRRRVPYVSALVRYDETPMGWAMGEPPGFAKCLASPRGEILGFHVVGPHASVLVHQVVPAMRWRNHVSSLTDAMTVHPSLSEVVAEAAWRARDRLARSPSDRRRARARREATA